MFTFQENLSRIVYVNESHIVETAPATGGISTPVHYDQNSSDSSSICTLNNVLPPMSYDYHHHASMAGLIGGPNAQPPPPPPPVHYTVPSDEHHYSPAVIHGGGSTDGGGGANCYAHAEVKPSARVRSYESERGEHYPSLRE